MDEFIVKRDAWHKTIGQFGDPVPKQLPGNFIGQGIKEGFQYYRYFSGSHIYFYQVTNVQTREVHFEIFQRLITGDRRNKRELYPWEEPVCNSIEEFKNSGAANYRFSELLRESDY